MPESRLGLGQPFFALQSVCFFNGKIVASLSITLTAEMDAKCFWQSKSKTQNNSRNRNESTAFHVNLNFKRLFRLIKRDTLSWFSAC